MGANLPRLFARREVSQVPPGSYPETCVGWFGRSLLGGLPGEAPQETLHRQPDPFAHLLCLCPEFRRHQQHPSSMRFMSHHVLYYYRGEGTQASGASGACGDRGACGGRKRTTALISHDSDLGPAPVRENRIQFPTHRPDVQDAQCCVQVGRFLTFFPTPGFPGHQAAYFCDYYCSCMPRVIGTLGRVGEGRRGSWKGSHVWGRACG